MNTQVPVHAPINPDQPDDTEFGMAEDGSGAPAFDLRLIWSIVYRNRYIIAAIVATMLILALIATMLMTPRYLAVATVQIEQQDTKVLEGDDTTPIPAIQDADRFLQTQIDILKSRSLDLRVMQSLNLEANDQFLVGMHQTPLTTPMPGRDLKSSKREQMIGVLDDNLTVNLPLNSRIVQIMFKSPDQKLAAQIANSYANNFIILNLQRRFDTSAYARNFLSQQLAETKARLEDSERAMIAYARSAGLIDASSGVGVISAGDDQAVSGPRSLTTSNLVQVDQDWTQSQVARVQAQQHWAQSMSTPLLSLPEVLSDPTIQALKDSRAQAQADYEQQRMRRKPEFPQMQQAIARMSELDNQINKLATATRDSIRSKYLDALRTEKALSGSVNQLKQDTLGEQDRSVRYNILKRETDTNRAMYDELLQRFKEVSAAAGLSANNISIVDVADPPVLPVSPKPLLNLAFATMFGFAIAGMVVFVREKFDDAVRSPEDVQRKLGLTFLNSIPVLRTGETPYDALADSRSGFSEAYAALRTSLELVTSAGLPHSILLTSSRQGEGKSTSAYAIARHFARLGKKVLLIDSDLRKPSLHRLLGTPNINGFASVLARHRTIEDVLQPTDTPNLSFIPSGPLPPNPAELLSGALLPQAMRQFEEMFDLVILDGPPVLGLADAVLLANNTQGTMFVIEANGSHYGHAKAAIRRLAASRANLIGALLTKFDAKKMGYSEYGYAYSYSYSYSYGLDADGKKN